MICTTLCRVGATISLGLVISYKANVIIVEFLFILIQQSSTVLTPQTIFKNLNENIWLLPPAVDGDQMFLLRILREDFFFFFLLLWVWFRAATLTHSIFFISNLPSSLPPGDVTPPIPSEVFFFFSSSCSDPSSIFSASSLLFFKIRFRDVHCSLPQRVSENACLLFN